MLSEVKTTNQLVVILSVQHSNVQTLAKSSKEPSVVDLDWT